MYTLPTAALLALMTLIPSVESGEPDIPDLSTLSPDGLQLLCEQLYRRIYTLEREVKDLKAQLQGSQNKSDGPLGDAVNAVDEGTWMVTIDSNPVPDTGPLEQQIAEHRARISDQYSAGRSVRRGSIVKGIDSRLEDARTRLNKMEGERERYLKRDHTGRQIAKTRAKYTYKQLSEPRNAVRQLENEKKKVERDIAKLKAKIKQKTTSRQITGHTDDGVVIRIIATGVYYQIGVGLEEGKTYSIVGRGHFSTDKGTIYIEGASQAND